MPKLTMDGTRLRALRTALGMTLMECSNLLGVSISTSQRWEKRVDLDEKKIAHIAGAFGVPPEFLTGGTDPVRIPEDCAAVRYMKARHRKFDYAAILPLDPEEAPFAEAAEVAADGREAFSYALAEDGICSAESDAQTSAETACPVSCTPPCLFPRPQPKRKLSFWLSVFLSVLAGIGISVALFFILISPPISDTLYGEIVHGSTIVTIITKYDLAQFLFYSVVLTAIAVVAIMSVYFLAASLWRRSMKAKKTPDKIRKGNPWE